VFVPPSSPIPAPVSRAPRLQVLREGAARDQVRSVVAEFESLTDPRGASGVRYRLSSLLALVVCAMTPAGHDSITAAAEWCQRAAPEELAAFGLPYHPLLGRYRVPSEKTLRSVLSRLDPAELSAAGFAYLTSLLPDRHATPAPLKILGLSCRFRGWGYAS
jgi:DDE_Tnp_1-associated